MGLDAVQASAVIPNEKGILEKKGRGFHFVTPFAKQHLFYVLYESEYLCDINYRVKRDYLDCLMLVYVLEGRLELRYMEKYCFVEEGQLAFLDLHNPHEYGAFGGKLRTEQILINGNAARPYFELLCGQTGFVFPVRGGIRRQMDLLMEELGRDEPDDHAVSVEIHGLFAEILTAGRHSVSEMAEKAMHYMEEHCREMLSLDDIAGELALNKYYFSRQFLKETGYTPWEYLIRVRIREAFRYLSGSDDSIEIIAENCGFASASHFIRTFKKETGMTPNYYRKQFT